MLCVSIRIVVTMLFISSCVTIGTSLGATLGGLPGFLYPCITIDTSLGTTLGGIPGFIFYCVTIGTSLGSTLGGLPGFIFSCFSIVTPIGSTLGGLPGFLFCACNLGAGFWCWCFIVEYWCVNGVITWSGLPATSCLSQRCQLCLLVDFSSVDFGIMLNKSVRILNTALCVSFIVVNGAFGVGFCDA